VTRSPSIASLTLAYNSAHLLPRQLDALLEQSRSLDEIIVVNNGSHDETKQVLSQYGRQITVLDLTTNMGVGAGYAYGLEYAALQKKHDWVWLLDHDSIPQVNALEALLNALDLIDVPLDTIGILACSPIHPGTQMSYPGLLWGASWKPPSSHLLTQPVCFVDVVISSGSLIRRQVAEQVGLPRADFFIDFVDFEYCLRLRRHNYKIAVVRDSRLDHAIGTPRKLDFFGFSRSWTEQPPWREYYLSRNYTYTVWNYYPDWKSKLCTVKWLLRHAAAVLAFGRNKRACLRMMLSGFSDGRAGRLGIRHLGTGPSGPSGEIFFDGIRSSG
jgi:GT2 family glycosyltransferase